jgi:putative 4-mercaptohistidine N1-methyltranferase
MRAVPASGWQAHAVPHDSMNAADYYESDRGLGEYLLFHYGQPRDVLPWPDGPVAALDYPVRCVTGCLDVGRLPKRARGLDLGCAVGRSTFELARYCADVVGVDYSHRFIETANRLRAAGALEYRFTEEGHLTTNATATVPPDIARERVTFEQGDAQALRADLGPFDVVLMANLVDRLHDPKQCLAQLPRLVRPGGQVILSTPCTWLEDYTPPSNWLGGFTREGKPVRTLDSLEALLKPHFDLLHLRDLPFLIREHARKFQWSVAQASTWIRRQEH